MVRKYPYIKDIIVLLGMKSIVSASILMPGLPIALGVIQRAKRKLDWEKSQKEWKKFNQPYLKRNLNRLQKQKIVEIIKEDGEEIIKLTQKGYTIYLKFKLEKFSLTSKRWDGKWRIVVYDIGKFKRNQQSVFRDFLRYMNFLKLQKSVYITPYPFEQQITYLREYFDIGDEVILIRADRIENEQIYKQYFGL